MLDEIKTLPIKEKLQLVEELWDDIGASDEPFPVQPWHLEEARRRSAELDAERSVGLTRSELLRKIEEENAK